MWLAGLRRPRADREFLLGDLEEEYQHRLQAEGHRAATVWYWRAALRAFRQTRALDRDHTIHSIRSRGGFMQAFHRDCVVAFRRVWTRPLMALAVITTLALGIGANVAMFSVAWPVLAAPLPFPDETRLTIVSLTYERNSARSRNQVSVGDFNDLRTARGFVSMAAFSKYLQQRNLTGRGEPEQLAVGAATTTFFSTLGVTPIAGRLFHPSDDQGGAPALVLGERTWRRRFGADRSVIGTTLRLDGSPYEVIGVAPASAGLGTIDPDAWVPLGIDPSNRQRGAYYLGVIGRLTAETTLQAANQELAIIMQNAASEFPQFNSMLSAEAEPFRAMSAAPVESTMRLLLVSAGLVLLVAVINLIGLQAARHLERAKEFAVRRALGASSWQISRQILTEHLVLAVLGGLAGVGVAVATLALLESVAPSFGWQHLAPASRGSVAAFALVLTMLTGLVVGGVPALRAGRSRRGTGLQTRAVTTNRWGSRMGSVVVGAQVAATAMLLVAASLVGRSQLEALSVDTGFTFARAVAADVNVPAGRYDSLAATTGFFDRLIERVTSTPGVAGACVTNEVPLDRGPGTMTYVAEGATRLVSALPTTISDGCIEVLGVPLVAGRWFTNQEAFPSVVVSQSMARRLWADGRNPVGQRVHFGLPTGEVLTIVGVSGDIRGSALEGDWSPVVWMPQSLGFFTPKRLLVRYHGSAGTDPSALRAALKDVDPEVALANVRSLDDILAQATAPRRFALFLLGAFAVTTAVLCCVGIYSLLAQSVGRRTQEIGIRVALGARSGAIARLVGIRVLMAVAVGLGAGLWSASALTSTISALLFGVTATDPRVYGLVAAGVAAMAALAAWVPTRRALRIAPVTALRGD